MTRRNGHNCYFSAWYVAKMAFIILQVVGFPSSFYTCSFHLGSNRHAIRRIQCVPAIPRESTRVFARTVAGAGTDISREKLQLLTVKDLRKLIDVLGIEKKGLSGKRKAGLIEVLIDSIDSRVEDPLPAEKEALHTDDGSVPVPSESPAPDAPRMKTKGTGMPPMPLVEVEQTEEDISVASHVHSAKANIYKKVLDTYPPLRNVVDPHTFEHLGPSLDGLGDRDIRHKYHPMLNNLRESDLDVVFVGTASCTPGTTRGVSCTALRLQWRRKRGNNGRDKAGKRDTSVQSLVRGKAVSPDGIYDESGNAKLDGDSDQSGNTWLFDCGESTQLQIQRTGSIRPGKISKIFITHAHGDHSFGLPGLLCLMGTNRDRESPPIDIYGPEGLRVWLRVAIRYSVSRIVPPYRVHELMDIPMAPEWTEARRNPGRFFFHLENAGEDGGKWGVGNRGLAGDDPVSWISRAPMIDLKPSSRFGEIPGGRDIFPIYDHPLSSGGAPVWEVEDEGDVRVYAAPMSHGVPCVGYVVEEESKPGRLRPDLVEPIVKRNYNALREAGMKSPMKVMAIIKDLPEGGHFTFPDGTVLNQSDVVEPSRNGRKVVICGDTADARAMEKLAQSASLVIHEATNTFLAGVDRDTNMKQVTKDAIIHGHSTPQMAGAFAKRVGAKRLVLNHFSPRYKGNQSLDSMSIMTRIEHQARKASDLPIESVAAAWDLMILPVSQDD